MNYKLVIFDLDGVLVDACEWHRVALNESLKDICDYEISLKDHYSVFNGIPTKTKLNKLTEMGILPEEKHDLIYDLKQKKTIETINKHAQLRQEKIDLLSWIKEQNITVACYTNSIRETAELMLEKTGVIKIFDLILTNQDVSNPKPDPEGYNYIVNKYGFNKNEVLIVEDSPKGTQAAVQSGCNVWKVDNPDQVNIKNMKEYVNESFNSDGRCRKQVC